MLMSSRQRRAMPGTSCVAMAAFDAARVANQRFIRRHLRHCADTGGNDQHPNREQSIAHAT